MGKKELSYTLVCEDVTVTVTPKRVKRLNLRVKRPDGTVVMSVPMGTSRERVARMVEEHLDWIRRAQARIKAKPENKPQHSTDDETVSLFGMRVPLYFVEGVGRTICMENGLTVYVPTGADAMVRTAYVERYLKKTLVDRVTAVMPHLAARVGKTPSSWYIRKMTTRWGTCNTKTGRVCLNLNLVYYPPQCLDYVIIHELCHLYVKGHGKDFWQYVERYCPDYKQARGLLKGR